MRGFLGTAAALVFAFSLITTIYSLTEVQPGFSGAARAGLAVESARWAVEAGSFNCSGSVTYEQNTKTGIAVSGGTSDLTDYAAGPVSITVHLTRDYAPGAKLDIGLTNTTCDPNGDTVTSVFQYDAGAGWVETADASAIPAGAKVRLKAMSSGGTGYSNNVTKT